MCQHDRGMQVWQEWVQRQKDKDKERKHKREKRDRERHRSNHRDADGERPPAEGDRERHRGDGDKDTPDGTAPDSDRASKRARHSGSPVVGGATRERDHHDKEGAPRETPRGDPLKDEHMESDATENKKGVSTGDVEEGEL